MMRMMMKVSAVLKSHDSAGLHAITLSVRPSVRPSVRLSDEVDRVGLHMGHATPERCQVSTEKSFV